MLDRPLTVITPDEAVIEPLMTAEPEPVSVPVSASELAIVTALATLSVVPSVVAPATCSVAEPEAVIAALLDMPAAKSVPEPVMELLT